MTAPDLAGRRVFVFAKGFAPDEGGMQTYAAGVAHGYAALGASVTVFSQTSIGPRVFEADGLRLVDIGPGKSPLVIARLRAAVRREMRANGAPDFVHATTWRTAVIARLAGLAFAVTVHGREMARTQGLAAMVMRHVLARAERIVAVSHYTRRVLLVRFPELTERTVIAWNGCDSDPASACGPKDTDPPLVLTLCRIEPRKNVATAIGAVAACNSPAIRCHYIVAGRGPDLAKIRAQAERLSQGQAIRIAGFVSDDEMATLYHRAAIFLHPQIAVEQGRDFEGFGIAIADAMAAGCACIVGRDGGTPELVEDGVSGIVVDGHDGEEVGAALRMLLDDTERCRAIGTAARTRAARFTWDRHVRIALGTIPGD
ncbi:glycosyltransferase family 4 protein [Flavisphingopyxis soli]|nr:glycosyltransferase family 4 protein [Sphingorhabdus soli]